MKIALFGGSFDPPHKGHNAVIEEALKTIDIDQLIIMPTFINPFKKEFFADEEKRLEWVIKLWGNLDKVKICDFEIKQKRPVPSIESVEYLYKIYRPSKFYFLIGADHLEKLYLWHQFEKLASLVEFVIAKRDNIEIPEQFKDLKTDIKIASSFIRNTLNTDEVCGKIKDEVRNYYKKFQKN
ncbi:nicotinate (nicotinamide) nucleotide adenylyltransferase [Campylobacter sp. W0014]|uniref:nicotinate (nicotinamide) nucleotide adenylyltransferase n=1 Tax=Campylobacter sp. W0014 TaxID=2735781 RepID=UPI001EC88B90|nr:nicotinate (nicotinamide) nucleotide adenylyltransferase [Campylobacter sp. W0014]